MDLHPRIWNDGVYYGENSVKENKQKKCMTILELTSGHKCRMWNSKYCKFTNIINKGHDTTYQYQCKLFSIIVLRNSKPTEMAENNIHLITLNADRKIYNEWSPENSKEIQL